MNNENRLNCTTSTPTKYKKVSKNTAEHLTRFVLDEGLMISEAARRLSIPYNTSTKIIERQKNLSLHSSASEVLLNSKSGRSKILTDETLNAIESIIEENNTLTLKQIKSELETAVPCWGTAAVN